MQKVLTFVAATALLATAALSPGATARAEMIPGGWLTMPRIPDPPPEAEAPAQAAIRPIPPPRPKITKPAVQRPPARPPSDGKVQF
jgi:hypothetical protein